MNTQRPWFKYFVGDIAMHCQGLNMTQECIFHRLIRYYWAEGKSFSKGLFCEKQMQNAAGVVASTWAHNRELVLSRFTETEDAFTLPWMDEQIAAMERLSEERSKAGKKGGRPPSKVVNIHGRRAK